MIESLAPANDSFSFLFLFPAKRIIVSYMTNKEIIASIQKQLTGDKTHDTGLLSRCSEKYQDNKEVFQYIQSILDGFENQKEQEEKKEYTITTRDFDKILMKAKGEIDKKNYTESLSLLQDGENHVHDFILKYEKTKKNKNIAYYYFFSTMEFALTKNFYNEHKSSIVLPYDYVSLLTLRGQDYFFSGKPKEAKASFMNALTYDPVSVDILFLMADLDYQNVNYLSFRCDLDKISLFLYKEDDFYRYYRYLALYYANFEDNIALSEFLKRLGSKTDKTPFRSRILNLKRDEINLLNENKIAIDISDVVLSTIVENMKEHLLAQKDDVFHYFYDILHHFKSESEIKDLIQGENEHEPDSHSQKGSL